MSGQQILEAVNKSGIGSTQRRWQLQLHLIWSVDYNTFFLPIQSVEPGSSVYMFVH